MPSFSPITTWVAGAVPPALMNSKINTPLTELQTYTPRGILYSATSNALVSVSSTAYSPIPNLGGLLTVDSPRTLQAVLRGYVNTDTAGNVFTVVVRINGSNSIIVQSQLPAAGTAGQFGVNAAGIAIPVAAGAVELIVEVRRLTGGGATQVPTGMVLQIIDQGAG